MVSEKEWLESAEVHYPTITEAAANGEFGTSTCTEALIAVSYLALKAGPDSERLHMQAPVNVALIQMRPANVC